MALASPHASENLLFPAHPPALLLRVDWGAEVKRIFCSYPVAPVWVAKESSGPVFRTWNPGWDKRPLQ